MTSSRFRISRKSTKKTIFGVVVKSHSSFFYKKTAPRKKISCQIKKNRLDITKFDEIGVSPSGKASAFGADIRWFESSHPSQF